MATLQSPIPSPEAADAAATHPLAGDKAGFDERFRKARLRAAMFGGGEPAVVRIGRYRIKRRLGAGTMGSVYLAVDESLERNVAVKVLRREDDLHRARMQREAKALAKLSHPNVVTVHEVGEQDGEVFVAMEYVPGQTLTEWLADPHSLDEILRMFAQAAHGLGAAHDAGVVHRDFKPDNAIVGEDGRVRVLDFGLAHSPENPLVDEIADPEQPTALAKPTLTRTGLLAGTPAYMSPEQFLGARVDARADQFSFCVALREAVWGERPYAADTVAELARAVLHGEPALDGTSRRGTTAQVEAVRSALRRGLSRDPGDRFASMGQLVQALQGTAKPSMRAFFVMVTLLFSMVLGLVAFVLSRGPEDTPAPVAIAPASAEACEPGHIRDGDRCVEVVWDPATVSCVSGTCQVPRSVLAALANGDDFRRGQGRLVPSMRDGKTIGYKIYGVRSHSLASVLGLHSGDLLTALDGVALDGGIGWSTRLNAVLESEGEVTFTLDYERQGTPTALKIVVRGAR